MPLSPSGVYTLPGGYLAVTGQDILPSQHNPPLEDIANVLSEAFYRTGVAPMLANLNMNTFKLLNVANGTNPTDGVNLSQLTPALPINGIWTPTVTAGSGTITTVGGTSGIYIKIGICVFFSATVTIVNNGTGASSVRITNLPFPCNTRSFTVTGRANVLSGFQLQGIIAPSTSVVSIFNYDNTYPAASGETLVVTGFYMTTS